MKSLFKFKKEILNPAVAPLLEKYDAATTTSGTAAKADALLAVKEETENTLNKIAQSQLIPALMYAVGMLVVPVVIAAVAIPFLGAVAPAVAVGGMIACVGGMFKSMFNQGEAQITRNILTTAVANDLSEMLVADPAGTMSSPRVVKELKDLFNRSSAEPELAKLREAVLSPKVSV